MCVAEGFLVKNALFAVVCSQLMHNKAAHAYLSSCRLKMVSLWAARAAAKVAPKAMCSASISEERDSMAHTPCTGGRQL